MANIGSNEGVYADVGRWDRDTMDLDNEPDFEVTDLRTGMRDVHCGFPLAQRGWQQWVASRRRVLTGLVIAVVLLAVLVVSFARVPSVGSALRHALHLASPTANPQLALGSDYIYFEHGVPWGALSLDGKPVTDIDTQQPYTGLDQLDTSMHLPLGRHQLIYTAAPFPPLQCQISVPAARSDTCPLIRSRSAQDVTPPYPAERVVNLGGDPSRLPSTLLFGLQAQVASAISSLSSSTSIPAGESFAGVTGNPQRATATMTATLHYSLASDSATIYVIPGSAITCVVLCVTQAASYINSSTDQWVVAAHVILAWSYRQGDGLEIPGRAAPQGVIADSVVPLNVSWQGSWRVGLASAIVGSPMCSIAFNLIAAEHLSGAPLSMLRMQPATNPADGCLVIGDALDADAVPRIPFTVMYRFGLLLDVDDEAHHLLPALPLASPELRALANAWSA